jgi:hypothetical protein
MYTHMKHRTANIIYTELAWNMFVLLMLSSATGSVPGFLESWNNVFREIELREQTSVTWPSDYLKILPRVREFSAIAKSHTLHFTVTPSLLSKPSFNQSLPNDGFQQCLLLPCPRSYRLATITQFNPYTNCTNLTLKTISRQCSDQLNAVSKLNSPTNRSEYNICARIV